ncbi:hypothetical protein [Nocardia stercoris]|uniref:CopG family transcriptional regulator n=1 Tax=Nocardia stercoris TaxID=2483361 RepID=A0A3M2KZT5_9NOCA|nr:hypothetical protein [Nocardia stercoris]RMI29960.1 hypothetical protein EBN03_23660 [Nocardia stercoris]
MNADEQDFGLGDGPAVKVSVSMRAGTVRRLRERLGKREFSAYVDAAVERQLERDLLEEALLVNEAIAGPVSPEVEEEIAVMFRDFMTSPELREES